MSAETDLLMPKPLPRVLVHVLHEGDMELEAVGNYYNAAQVRACVSSATEALRAEVAKQSAYAKRTHDWNTELLTNNERLAEALRRMTGLALEVVPALEATRVNVSLAADVKQAADAARAALDQETTNG